MNFTNPYGLKSREQNRRIYSGKGKNAKPGADRPKSNISQSEIQSAWGNISYYQAAAAAAGGLRAQSHTSQKRSFEQVSPELFNGIAEGFNNI